MSDTTENKQPKRSFNSFVQEGAEDVKKQHLEQQAEHLDKIESYVDALTQDARKERYKAFSAEDAISPATLAKNYAGFEPEEYERQLLALLGKVLAPLVFNPTNMAGCQHLHSVTPVMIYAFNLLTVRRTQLAILSDGNVGEWAEAAESVSMLTTNTVAPQDPFFAAYGPYIGACQNMAFAMLTDSVVWRRFNTSEDILAAAIHLEHGIIDVFGQICFCAGGNGALREFLQVARPLILAEKLADKINRMMNTEYTR